MNLHEWCSVGGDHEEIEKERGKEDIQANSLVPFEVLGGWSVYRFGRCSVFLRLEFSCAIDCMTLAIHIPGLNNYT